MDHNKSIKDRESILFVIELLQNLLTEEDAKSVTKPSKSNTIKRNKPNIKQGTIDKIISENKLKSNNNAHPFPGKKYFLF